jgi:hypothetical protein
MEPNRLAYDALIPVIDLSGFRVGLDGRRGDAAAPQLSGRLRGGAVTRSSAVEPRGGAVSASENSAALGVAGRFRAPDARRPYYP